jgi:hypothetical protein
VQICSKPSNCMHLNTFMQSSLAHDGEGAAEVAAATVGVCTCLLEMKRGIQCNLVTKIVGFGPRRPEQKLLFINVFCRQGDTARSTQIANNAWERRGCILEIETLKSETSSWASDNSERRHFSKQCNLKHFKLFPLILTLCFEGRSIQFILHQ